jgi:hypothetical protein
MYRRKACFRPWRTDQAGLLQQVGMYTHICTAHIHTHMYSNLKPTNKTLHPTLCTLQSLLDHFLKSDNDCQENFSPSLSLSTA